MTVIRMMPIRVAHRREYQGPSITEQVMLIRWAMGHMPSTRRMGEITTPRPIIMDKNTRRRTFCCLLSIKKLHSFMDRCSRSFRRGIDSISRIHSTVPKRRPKPVMTVGTLVPSQPGTRAPSLQNEYRSRALPLDRYKYSRLDGIVQGKRQNPPFPPQSKQVYNIKYDRTRPGSETVPDP